MEITVQRGQPHKPLSHPPELQFCSPHQVTEDFPFSSAYEKRLKRISDVCLDFDFLEENMFAALSGGMKASTVDCKNPSGCHSPLSSAGNYMFSVSPVLSGNTNIFCAAPCVFTWRGGACVKQVTLSRN